MGEVNTLESHLKGIGPTHILPRMISSEILLGHMKQVLILHEGRIYQLRITKLGKLILTK